MSGVDQTDSTSSNNPAGLSTKAIVVALVGNPNTGKTTLFNGLTGYRRHVANYPGVTVELAKGPLRDSARSVEIVDLPGTYSLAALSPDEMVVCNFLSGRIEGQVAPDCVLAILDAANLPRNLYLLSQVLEIGLPVVVALNMVDLAEGRGIHVDPAALSARLGVAVVPVVATDAATLSPLASAIQSAAHTSQSTQRAVLPPAIISEVAALADVAAPAEALRILLDTDGHAEKQFRARGGSAVRLATARERLKAAGIEGAAAEVRARYAWIGEVLPGVISRSLAPPRNWSDRLDRILTHKLGGALVLLLVLTVLFQAIFRWATPVMDFINDGVFGALAAKAAEWLPAGPVQSLICDGVIAGVGSVLVFLPQILILFALIAVLEDCGYMARAAFMMDRIMRAAGLSGRSFIPLLSSFACAIPAIMGARVIADRRDRFVTILIAPFMSCSARLPVYVLLIAAFVPQRTYLGGWIGLPGLVMLAMYMVGIVVAIPVAWLLKKTAFAGPSPGFVLELPSYKLPRLRAIWQRMYFSGRGFIVRAGTVILAVNMTVWALGYFPHDPSVEQAVRTAAARAGAAQPAELVPLGDTTRSANESDSAIGRDEARLESEIAGAYLRDSYLGRMGRAIEPAIKPIGWDWRIGAAVVASFPAREVVVGTLGTIFNLGSADEESADLREAITAATWPDTGKRVFTLPVALSLMVFFALCAQCASTLVMIGRETGSWVWPVVSFVGMTGIAYVGALVAAYGARAAGW